MEQTDNIWTAKDKTAEEICKLYGKRKNQLLAKNSPTERYFLKLLREQPEYFIREKAFFADGFLCYVDFFFPLQKLAIELDGKEHQSERGQHRDKIKSEFLLNKRQVVTYRISNSDCLSMKSVDINDIANQAWASVGRNMAAWQKERICDGVTLWMSLIQPKTKIDLSKPIYAYSKANDKVYTFANCHLMRLSTGMTNKDLIRNLENPNNYTFTNFIVASDLSELSKKMALYRAE